jgi:hypothetical protein
VASRFKLPFSERERFARNKRDRYYRDPVYRLKRINETRQRSGQAPYERSMRLSCAWCRRDAAIGLTKETARQAAASYWSLWKGDKGELA